MTPENGPKPPSTLVADLIEEFRPLYKQTLQRALDAEELVGRCLTALNHAAAHGDRDAIALVNDLRGSGYTLPRRWWQIWKRR